MFLYNVIKFKDQKINNMRHFGSSVFTENQNMKSFFN